MDTGLNTDTPNLEQLMQLGIQTAKQGNKQSARVIFQQILESDKQNERAWLWMAAVAETPEDRARYLNTVLRINPSNPTAQRELQAMQTKRESSNSRVIILSGVAIVVVVFVIVLIIVLLSAVN
ncbi:MAG: hypothetical protein GYB65_17690 [Chloroflexi bacterium]|nr:hypothetical protein [Chloroflexota bacterium]